MHASFVVHDDFGSRTSGVLTLSEDDGVVVTTSIKRQLNVWSSTEVEPVAGNDAVAKITWVKHFWTPKDTLL